MGMGDLLNQDEIWISRKNGELVTQRLEEMPTRHLRNLRNWMKASEGSLHNAAIRGLRSAEATLQGEQALYDIGRDIADLEGQYPHAWLRKQPFYQAITQLIDKRDREERRG